MMAKTDEMTGLAAVPVSVCIVSHHGYGALCGSSEGFVGGVEIQTSLLARWLAGRGHRVSMVTWQEGGAGEEWIGGVRVLKVCREDGGMPGMRFFHPRWTGLVSAMRAADADVYFHNCGECVTGQAALWCRRHDRGFVFSAASEADCMETLPDLGWWRDRCLYLAGLRLADRVLVQTAVQERMMRENFGVGPEVVAMPCAGFGGPEPTARSGPPSCRVAWVGRVCQLKRPDMLLEIAVGCPGLQFDLVGPWSEDELTMRIREQATQIPNLTVHGRLQHGEIARIYAEAACLLSTSDCEGFPNTFLEAWSCGLPVVSRFDPDGLIAERKLGLVADDAAGLANALDRLISDPPLYQECSSNALEYFSRRHRVEVVMPEIESVLVGVAEKRSTRGRE